MRKKATRKDFYMEIRKSPGRFLSIFFIVVMGVAFFSGIRSAEPSMRITGDSYYDKENLMDIKVISTLGITEDDIEALENVDGVKLAEGAYSTDFLHEIDDEEKVLHVMSMTEKVNHPAVTEGRLPEKVGECLVDDEEGYKVGDKIKLKSGTEDPVTDTLKVDTLTVVGTGSTPYYISFNRGSTTIGTGNISAFVLVPEETFDMDVYTEAYLLADGAKEMTAYTDEYEDYIEDVMDRVENITDERAQIRRQELVDEANEALDEAKEELEEGKAEAQAELEDAAAQIADAEEQIESGRQKISDGRSQIEAAKATLNSKQQELDAAWTTYQEGVSSVVAGRADYESGLAQFEAGKKVAERQIAEGRAQMEALDLQIQEDRENKDVLEGKIEDLNQKIEELNVQIKELEDKGVSEDNEDLIKLKNLLGTCETGLAEAQTNLVMLGMKISEEERIYKETTASLDAAEQQIVDGAAALEQARAELEAGEAALAGVPEQLASGQLQIDAAWSEIETQERSLSEGEAEIISNQIKLEEAKQEYEEGKADAEEEIRDGEQKIQDAEDEIADIPEAKWYIYDRSTLPEYTGYGENADRMRAIGKYFRFSSSW